jgi:hypothetical protein
MRQLLLSLGFGIGGLVMLVIGVKGLLFPRRFQDAAIRDTQGRKFWWPWSVFARRFESPSYLWELRIGGAVAVLMGAFFVYLAIAISAGRLHP